MAAAKSKLEALLAKQIRDAKQLKKAIETLKKIREANGVK